LSPPEFIKSGKCINKNIVPLKFIKSGKDKKHPEFIKRGKDKNFMPQSS